MYLVYFDENKYEEANPCFWIGVVLIPEPKAIECDKTLPQIQFNVLGKTAFPQCCCPSSTAMSCAFCGVPQPCASASASLYR
jgi:hypothetical protein